MLTQQPVIQFTAWWRVRSLTLTLPNIANINHSTVWDALSDSAADCWYVHWEQRRALLWLGRVGCGGLHWTLRVDLRLSQLFWQQMFWQKKSITSHKSVMISDTEGQSLGLRCSAQSFPMKNKKKGCGASREYRRQVVKKTLTWQNSYSLTKYSRTVSRIFKKPRKKT